MLVSMVMLWGGDYTPKVQWTLTVLIVGVWLGFAFAVQGAGRHSASNPFQSACGPAGRRLFDPCSRSTNQ